METIVSLAHEPMGLLILSAIAFSDTLIGIGFFVPGEVAFVASGIVLATSGEISPAIIVLFSAWIADLTSYAIGKKYGRRTAAYWMAPSRRRKHWRQAQSALRCNSAKAVIISRVLGPVAWIMPFMAGATNLPFRTFFWCSAVGVIIGVGQFVMYGALISIGFESIGSALAPMFDFVASHLIATIVSAATLATGVLTWRWLPSRGAARVCLAICGSLIALTLINTIYFFGIDAHAVPSDRRSLIKIGSVCDLQYLPYQVKPGPTPLHRPQPINIALISKIPPETLMSSLGWFRNKTYSRDNISIVDFAFSLITKNLPVSELYWFGRPADSAFQLPGTLSKRVHIRWWNAGRTAHGNLYLASLSRDEEIAIKYYKHLPTILHDIARDVDGERKSFREQIEASANIEFGVLNTFPLGLRVDYQENSDYFSDGGVLLVTGPSVLLNDEETACLSDAPTGKRMS